MFTVCVRMLLVTAVVLLSVVSADAGPAGFNSLLKGDYAFVGSTTCLVSRAGFNANLTPLGPPAPFPFVTSFGVQGVRTFNGDGTGSVRARVISLSLPSAVPSPVVVPYTPSFNRGGASASDIEATFTYTVGADRTVVIDNTAFLGTIVSGSGAGQTFTIADFPQFVGYLGQDHKTLSIAHEDPTVETQTFSGGDVQHRVCHRPRTLLKR